MFGFFSKNCEEVIPNPNVRECPECHTQFYRGFAPDSLRIGDIIDHPNLETPDLAFNVIKHGEKDDIDIFSFTKPF